MFFKKQEEELYFNPDLVSRVEKRSGGHELIVHFINGDKEFHVAQTPAEQKWITDFQAELTSPEFGLIVLKDGTEFLNIKAVRQVAFSGENTIAVTLLDGTRHSFNGADAIAIKSIFGR